MIFKRISYQIALQFTAFVFLLFLMNGMIFLVADVANTHFQTRARLEQILREIARQPGRFGTMPPALPRFLSDRIRIANAEGEILFSGNLFANLPFEPRRGISTIEVHEQSFDVLTSPVEQDTVLLGYIQVADFSKPNDLPIRALIYLAISGAISALTFGVGLFFARRSLKPAEQMVERLEQFTQDASHELRTPLTAVSTSLDLALATNDYRENVLTAKKDLREIFTLVERLLELARLDKALLQTEYINFSELVQETVEKHRQFAQEKEISIDMQIAPGVRVLGDPSLLRQVISNLLGNAIKFNKVQGRIEVRLTPTTLKIQDTGKGISEEALPHIFNRFYQEESSRAKVKEGLGLGLALVKRIVELHGWTIAVQSKAGEGATFIIHLKASKTKEEPKR